MSPLGREARRKYVGWQIFTTLIVYLCPNQLGCYFFLGVVKSGNGSLGRFDMNRKLQVKRNHVR